MEKNVHYGEVLKCLVKKQNISVKELSERLNMTTQGLYNIFRNKSPRIDTIMEITYALGITIKEMELHEDVRKIRERAEMHTEYFNGKLGDQTENIKGQMNEQQGMLINMIKENREYYTSNLLRLEQRMDGINKALDMARELIEAKDQLITELRKVGKGAS